VIRALSGVALAFGLAALFLAPVLIVSVFVFGAKVSSQRVWLLISWGAAVFVAYGFVRAVLA